MKNKNGYGIYQSPVMRTDDWLTPLGIIQSLGEFDLDPCCPSNMPWPTAKYHYTEVDNGFIKDWFGRVWLNPPYGRMMYQWMNKLAAHANGIGLVFARTDTKGFQSHIFPHVDSMLFVAGRLRFCQPDGTSLKNTWAPAPSVLCAYGRYNVERLGDSGIKGKHILVNAARIVVIGISSTWKSVVSIAFTHVSGSAQLSEIYDLVERIAPDKVQNNNHYKEKIRQTLQMHFTQVKRGFYTNSTIDL